MGEVTPDLPPRVGYYKSIAALKPPAPPPSRGRTKREAVALGVWLWAMAQPFVGLTRQQAAQLAERTKVLVRERPITPAGVIHGEMYSQPDVIFLQYDEAGLVERVAVEDIWPNYWWPGWQDSDDRV